MRLGIDARMWGAEQTGIGRYTDRLLYHLARISHGHEMVIFAFPDAIRHLTDILANVSQSDNVVTFVPVHDRWYSWGEQTRFVRTLYRSNLDLLHVPHFNVPLLYRRPFVATMHDITPWRFPGHNMGRSMLRRVAFRHVFRSACRRAQRLVAVSDATRRDIARVTGRSDIEVVPEGPGFFDPYDVVTDALQVRHVTVPNRPYLFAVGVWREHKNFERLIAAFSKIKQRGHSRLLLVIGGCWQEGDPSLLHALQESPMRHDIITPGFLTSQELLAYYRSAQAVVVPSLAEGFGFVGLEAMHEQTPVVASQTGSLPEVYGDAAVFVDPYSISSLADGIECVLSDHSTQALLVARGNDTVRRYSWRRMAERMAALYGETLAA